jgi:LmbE family N-acetylglucosaminyl deacetylase
MNRTVLIVAAHSDDEALGCGGTIARHVAEGDTVHAVFMADGVTSRSGAVAEDMQQRLAAADKAHRILGLQRVEYLGWPDNRLDSVALLDVVQSLERVIREIAPQVIYTHHHGDLNIDHRITHEAVLVASRPLPGSTVTEIYGFEVLSSTEWTPSHHPPFVPNLFVEISQYLDIKLQALRAYGLEMRPAPHSRSIEHVDYLARHRGHSVGAAAAEAFVAIRILK